MSTGEEEELRDKVADLERELKASLVREQLGVVLPGVVKKTGRSSKTRKRSSGTESSTPLRQD